MGFSRDIPLGQNRMLKYLELGQLFFDISIWICKLWSSYLPEKSLISTKFIRHFDWLFLNQLPKKTCEMYFYRKHYRKLYGIFLLIDVA